MSSSERGVYNVCMESLPNLAQESSSRYTMTMKKAYVRRGKRVELEQIPELLAMKLDAESVKNAEPGQPIATWREKAWILANDAVPSSTQTRWESAGWYVVRESTESSQKGLPAPLAVGPILRNDRGEWMIGTQQLTVRLRDDLTEKKAQQTLANHKMSILHKMGFAPNLYEVQVSEDADAFALSVELSDNDDYKYAEPKLLKDNIGSRGA